MLTPPQIRYTVAFATPRDTHSLRPRVTLSRSLAPRALCLPESDQPIRATGVWSEPERRDWLASRLAAQRATAALMRQGGESSAGIEILRASADGRNGTDIIARRVAARTATRRIVMPLSVSLSVAHSGGHAVAAAAAHPARIGVDLERADKVAATHAAYFLSARERQRIRLTLTELWALKESAWKAIGCGDGTAFADLELIFGSTGEVCAIRLGTMVIPAAAALRRPWPGWIAAIVAIPGITD